jgi:hypothetical protein
VLAWRLKIEGTIDSTYSTKIVLDEINEVLYVIGTYFESAVFYDTSDAIISTATISVLSTSVFIAQYTYAGVLNWRSKIDCLECYVMSAVLNPINQYIIIGVRFHAPMQFYDAVDVTLPANDLYKDGDQNLSVIEYDTFGTLVNRFKIGGSSIESDIKLDVKNTQLVVSGTFSSNPTKLYDTNDTFVNTLTNNNSTSDVFIAYYTIDNTLLTKTNVWSTKMISSGILTIGGLSVSSDLSINILGTYASLLKFEDVSGYVLSKDLINTSGLDYLFLAKYDSLGNFLLRSSITSSGVSNVVGTSVDAKLNNIYISGYFSPTNITFLNSDDTVNSTIANLGFRNAFVASYINSIDNFLFDVTTLSKKILCKNLIGNELNYKINLNSFSQSLGFNSTQKSRAMVFGTAISWETLNISVLNNTLTVIFNLGDVATELFVLTTVVFTMDIFTNYTPYNLVYELNKIIIRDLTNNALIPFSQSYNPVIYDSEKNIFYLQFDIDGKFTVSSSTLANTTHLNLLTDVESPHCVVADKTTLEVGVNIAIKDNSKLSIKVLDNFVEQKFNDVGFSEAFPSITSTSGRLILSAVPNSRISATVGASQDNLSSDVSINDKLIFEAPWEEKNIIGSLSNSLDWVGIAVSSLGNVIAAIGDNDKIYISTNSGDTWTSNESKRSWKSIDISTNGSIQMACVQNGQIFVSTDAGSSWTPKDSSRNWASVSISGNGVIQVAVVNGGQPYMSYDTGSTWVPRNLYVFWKDVVISPDGTIIMGCSYGLIYRSIDSGLTWFTTGAANRFWNAIAMSSDGSIITASEYNFKVYLSVDAGVTWVATTLPNQIYNSISMSANGAIQLITSGLGIYVSVDTGTSWTIVSVERPSSLAMTDDGVIQYGSVSGSSIYRSLDTGSTWNPLSSIKTWKGVAISSDGIQQSAVVSAGGFDSKIYISSDAGISWEPVASNLDWCSIAMSSNGVIQSAVVDGGQIYISGDSGANWSVSATSPSTTWVGVDMSSNGVIQSAVINGGQIYISGDSGANWAVSATSPSINWTSIAISSNGIYQTATASASQIYVSSDSGTTWGPQNSPQSWSDVSISADGSIQVASINGGRLHASNDYGLTWTAVTSAPSTNWSSVDISSNGSYQTAVENIGNIYTSNNFGVTWTAISNIGNWVSVAMSSTGTIQIASASPDNIYISTNSGVTWKESSLLPSSVGVTDITDIAMSSNATIQTLVTLGGFIYDSNDSGNTWSTAPAPFAFWYSIAMSDDGVNQTAGSNSDVYVSNDSGSSWVSSGLGALNWFGIAMSGDGINQTAVVYSGQIYASTNTGATWNVIATSPSLLWNGVAMSQNGAVQTAVADFGQIYVSTDTGVTWNVSASSPSVRWQSITMSSDGVTQAAVATNYKIYLSVDSGSTWALSVESPSLLWRSIDVSADGVTQIAVADDSKIYISTDTGATWVSNSTPRAWNVVAMSDDGSMQVAGTKTSLFVHNFTVNQTIELNVLSIDSNASTQDIVYFNEVADATSNLNGINMADINGYSIQTITETGPTDLFIPVGDYTAVTLVSAVNAMITAINPLFTNAFTYDVITGLISFTSIYSGTNVITTSNLLKKMGLGELPATVTSGSAINANKLINLDISGPSMLFIKSNTIGELRKNITGYSTNSKIKNIISPLSYNDENGEFVGTTFEKVEIYLSSKETISSIDIQIVDENGDIINLNDGKVQISMYFYLS